ncbi:hypothetical protein N7541_008579 [Penicillium brevicompactum]|uniref:Uncharacterized protein n=1 Tax=Penicillium brevicompactum TaxID=5074 RepID=A0A9W9QZC9_PENBR|nr:hypothetical protein N7541_008579 [Penicillium brevicompactum]
MIRYNPFGGAKSLGQIGRRLSDLIYLREARNVDWCLYTAGKPLVHTPRDLEQFTATCAQRFGFPHGQ